MGSDVCVGALGSYEILRQLPGQNREIYLARRKGEASGRVVLAAFELRAEDARWLTDEVERCQRLEHEGITRIVESFQQDGKHAVVFEPVRGVALCTLMDHLRKEGERLADRAAHYLGEVLFGALACAHHQADDGKRSIPIVHGQLGPHQVFLSWEGEVKLLGLGLSRVFRLAQGLEAVPPEARPFLAPESRAGAAASTRSNVYTAAAMLWSLYTHELPDGSAERLGSLKLKRPDLPTEVAEVIDLALEPLVVRRGITAGEVLRVFEGRGGTEGRRELRWNVEVLRGADSVVDSVPLPNSFPPSRLSTAPRPPVDEAATPSERDPAVPAAPALPSDNLADEPTASPPTLPYAGVPAETATSAAAGRRDSKSPVSSDNMPTGSWQLPDRQGMQKLFEAAVAKEADASAGGDRTGSTDGSAAQPAQAEARAVVPRPVRPPSDEPPGERPEGRSAKSPGANRPATLTGIGALGEEALHQIPAPTGPRLGRRVAPGPELRTTKPSIGAVTRSGLAAPSARAKPPGGPPVGRTTQPIGAARVVAGASRSSVIGRFGPPALEAPVERAPASRRDLRAEGGDGAAADGVVRGGASGANGEEAAGARGRKRGGTRRGRHDGPTTVPPVPGLPRVVVVAEAVRPSTRPPRLYDDPVMGPGPDGPHPEHDGSVPGSKRPYSLRPHAPRSRGSNMRGIGEAPVSGRLVSVRPAGFDADTPLAGPANDHGLDASRGAAGQPAGSDGDQASPATERAPSGPGAATTANSDAPAVLPRSLRVGSLVPTRWVVPIAAVIAVVAIVSFATGLLVGSGPLDVRVATEGSAHPAGGPPASAGSSGPGSVERPAVTPSALASAEAHAGDGSAPGEASAQPSAEPAEDDGDDGSRLPAGFGYLLVRSSAADVHVYVSGAPIGLTGKKLLVRCGLLHVRLGEVPLRSWLSPGKPVSVVCQGVTSVAIDPGKPELAGSSPNAGPATPSTPRFVPEEL